MEKRKTDAVKRSVECAGDEWSDAIVASMKLGGVDKLFFVSGSEVGYYQEAIAKAEERGWPAPQLVTMVHEGVALNAALGHSMVTGKPAATAHGITPAHLNSLSRSASSHCTVCFCLRACGSRSRYKRARHVIEDGLADVADRILNAAGVRTEAAVPPHALGLQSTYSALPLPRTRP